MGKIFTWTPPTVNFTLRLRLDLGVGSGFVIEFTLQFCLGFSSRQEFDLYPCAIINEICIGGRVRDRFMVRSARG